MKAHGLPFGALVLTSIALSLSRAQPVAAQALTFAQVGTIPGPVDLVRAQGQFVYVTAGKTLAVYDVSNPATPKRAGQHTFPEKIWGFRVVGSRAYVADGHSGLGILDISNPSALVLISLFKTPGQAKNASVAGNKALVANHNSGVDIIDISNPAKPTLLGSSDLDGYARDVATFGSHAFAVDNPSGLYVFDLNRRNPLDPITTLQSATAPQQVEVAEIAAGRGLQVAVLAGNEPYDPLATVTVRAQTGAKPRPGSVQLFDVSNPATPVLVGAYPTSGSGRRLAIKSPLVYIADGPEGLRVLDVSTPSKATVVGSFKTAKPTRDIAVAESLVFVVIGTPHQGSRSQEDGDVVILRQAP